MEILVVEISGSSSKRGVALPSKGDSKKLELKFCVNNFKKRSSEILAVVEIFFKRAAF